MRPKLVPALAAMALVTGVLAVVVPAGGSHTPDPITVTVVGSFQDEFGCAGDWQPDCATTGLAHDGVDDVWQGSFNVPAGSWEYKAALDDSFAENYGAGAVQDGPNIPINLSAATDVRFYYDHNSHWITDNVNSTIATAAGSYQDELGCTGDWQPDCLRSWLQDPDGDGTYVLTTTAIPAGSYEFKVAIDEDWNESHPAANVAFAVPIGGATVTFTFDAFTLDVDVQVDADVGPIIYVDTAATGANDGSSWTDAFTDLQDGLAAASLGDEIRVAEGTYTPHASDRSVTFAPVDGVNMVGGYESGGVAGPDPRTFESILSGDLNGDDLPDGVNTGENSYHVVGSRSPVDTVIDGFTITGGNANGPELPNFDNSGGGVFPFPDGSFSIVNSRIINNTAEFGGGVYSGPFLGSLSLSIINTVISDNTALVRGGGINNTTGSSSMSIVNSLISDNAALDRGGGINAYNTSRLGSTGSLSIVNTTIAGNIADEGSGIHGEGGTELAMRNAIVWGNAPSESVIAGMGASTVDYSDVEGWTGGGVGNIDEDPLFVGSGDYRLQPGSPAIDAGDNTAAPADAYDVDDDGDTTEPTPDLGLNDRIQGAAVDMGAYESVAAQMPVVTPGQVTVVEGDGGTVVADVPVSLSAPSALPITVDYVTADYTATAPADYEAAATTTLTFAPGETETVVPVTVNGDLLPETDEIALVSLRNPTNATIGGFYGLGFVTIVDDDPEPVAVPWIGVTLEGDTGTTTLDVPIHLSAPSGLPVTLDWTTHDLTATASDDYQAASGMVTIDPGEILGVATITANGDTWKERPEVFLVSFRNPDGATLGGFHGLGFGLIVNDD